MSNFLLIALCLILGVIFHYFEKIPRSAARSLNAFVISISYPAVVLLQAPNLLANLSFSSDYVVPALMPWIFFVVTAGVTAFVGHRLGWSRGVVGAISLTAGLGNTSFVGFPMLEALFGPESLKTGIIIDQAGTFLVTSTLGILLASYYAGEGISWRSSFQRVVLFPPFLALVASTILFFLNLSIPDLFVPVLSRLGDTLAPLALFSVGLQLSVQKEVLKKYSGPLAIGLAWKMVLAPLFLFGALTLGTDSLSVATQITLIESAMAPMITAAIIATDNDLEPALANLMVGVGIPLSLFSIPVWKHFI